MRDLLASEERVTQINAKASSLTAAGHSDSPAIARRQHDINEMWAGVKELADTRQKVGGGSKLIFPQFYYSLSLFSFSVPFSVLAQVRHFHNNLSPLSVSVLR